MQVSFNNTPRRNPQFGAANFEDPRLLGLLNRRMLANKHWDMLINLHEAQKANPINIDFHVTPDGDRVAATIWGRGISEYAEESMLASIFCSPIRFIKNMCKAADVYQKEVQKMNE